MDKFLTSRLRAVSYIAFIEEGIRTGWSNSIRGALHCAFCKREKHSMLAHVVSLRDMHCCTQTCETAHPPIAEQTTLCPSGEKNRCADTL